MKYSKLCLMFLLFVGTLTLSGCTWLYHSSDQEASGYAVGITDSSGRTAVTIENKQINVNVEDEYGVSIPSVTVKAYALEEDVLIFAGSEDYLPGIKILTPSDFSTSAVSGLPRLEPKFAVVTVTLMVIAAAGVISTVYGYYKNPGEFPVQIPGLIEGQRKVQSTCIQIDGNDIISIGSIILSGFTLFKGVQVLGAPAKLRGVTAMNFGFTKKMIAKKTAETIGKTFVKFAEILDTDIINYCTYEYRTNDGYEEMPYMTFDVQRNSTLTGVAHKIAFVSGRNPQGGIYMMNPDGTNVQGLSHGGQDPAWSPDGTRIAFTTAGARTLGSIYLMNSDGSNVRKLVDEVHGIEGIAWSPNGAKIAFASSPSQLGSPDIYVMNADGTNLHNITNYWAEDVSPTWSPDGTRIAFESYRDGEYDIYVMAADGGNVQRLTFAPYGPSAAREPAWSPNGDKIAFSIGFDIYVMDAAGSSPQLLTNTGTDNSPTWSPDGTRIAFVSWRDGNQEIYVMNVDGSNQHNITNNPAEDWDPAW